MGGVSTPVQAAACWGSRAEFDRNAEAKRSAVELGVGAKPALPSPIGGGQATSRAPLWGAGKAPSRRRAKHGAGEP